MKIVRAVRYTVTYPGQHGAWFGTCPAWAAEGRQAPDSTVIAQTVRVLNPTRTPCTRCGVSHVDVPNPN